MSCPEVCTKGVLAVEQLEPYLGFEIERRLFDIHGSFSYAAYHETDTESICFFQAGRLEDLKTLLEWAA